MQSDNPPDAIFVANDHMAFAVLDTLRDTLGLKVPEDVSVIGFDDVPQAAWRAYSLTTVAQPTDLMIEATVALLVDQLEEGHAASARECLPVEFIERKTARFPES